MIVAGMFELSGPAISQETALGREHHTTACEEAFAELVRRQSRFAFQVAHAVLRNVQDAEVSGVLSQTVSGWQLEADRERAGIPRSRRLASGCRPEIEIGR